MAGTFDIGNDQPKKRQKLNACGTRDKGLVATPLPAAPRFAGKDPKFPSMETERMGSQQEERITNLHRRDPFETNTEDKPVQSGTPQFIKELEGKKFYPISETVEVMNGWDVDWKYAEENGFTRPILVRNMSGLMLTVPDKSFDYDKVAELLGREKSVNAINVRSQKGGIELTLGEFADYMKASGVRDPILNIISLEFSKDHELSQLVVAPMFARDLSWEDKFYPDNLPRDGQLEKPEVQKFCLMSPKGSYTDFHIDFGGTSVWYHIFKGKKVFFLIEPTTENLAIYETWLGSETRSDFFLGDQCICFKLELMKGETMLMPSGWIHAVLTPEDSLVFGGNFLHQYGVKMQLAIDSMEGRLNIDERYRYPNFDMMSWLGFKDMSEQLERYVADGKCLREPPSFLTTGCKALYDALLPWMNTSKIARSQRRQLQPRINAAKVMQNVKKLLNVIISSSVERRNFPDREINKIICHDPVSRPRLYLVQWKRCFEGDCSWEAEKNIKTELLTEYWTKPSTEAVAFEKSVGVFQADSQNVSVRNGSSVSVQTDEFVLSSSYAADADTARVINNSGLLPGIGTSASPAEGAEKCADSPENDTDVEMIGCFSASGNWGIPPPLPVDSLNVTCDICFLVFTRKDALLRHRKRFHTVN